MIGEPTDQWVDRKLREAQKHPAFWMETHLFRFQEVVWETGGPNGIDRVLYRIFSWSAGKLIDRCYSHNKSRQWTEGRR